MPDTGYGYAPRPLRFLRREQVGDWRLKLYGISARGERPREEVVEATLAAPTSFLILPSQPSGTASGYASRGRWL